MTSTFDLTREPWVRVLLISGEETDLSLRDALSRAHEVRRLAGELPTQDAAVLRLLVAILRRSLGPLHGTEAWGNLWRGAALPIDVIEGYLDSWAHRFDLLHPSRPFFQVADLRTAKDEFGDLTKLVGDIPTGEKLFSTRSAAGAETLSLAEAARWLIHLHAFDPSGIKSGAVGDETVKGGKGYPIGTGWAGWLGLVIPEGASLFHTLLLNLPLGRGDSDSEVDLPPWEREEALGAARSVRFPAGPVDLLTWQSRRVRLGVDAGHVVGVLVCNGDPLHPRNRFGEEFMTSWRLSEAQMKALGTREDVWMPRAHPPDRQIWRGLGGLLADFADPTVRAKAGRWQEWLATLHLDEELSSTDSIRLRCLGMHYGAQSSTTVDISDDVLALPLSVLADAQRRGAAVAAAADSEVLVRRLGTLAMDIEEASGGSGDALPPARDHAKERAYAELDSSFRRWLADFDVVLDPQEHRRTWQLLAARIIARLAEEALSAAPPSAWIGHLSGDAVVDAALADRRFQRGLAYDLKNWEPVSLIAADANGAT